MTKKGLGVVSARINHEIKICLHQIKCGGSHIVSIDWHDTVTVTQALVSPCEVTSNRLQHVEGKLQHVLWRTCGEPDQLSGDVESD